jgi:histidinol-phosphate phosphatase family protein
MITHSPLDAAQVDAAQVDAAQVDAAQVGAGRVDGGLFDAVLFDRDGTLVQDVPYNGDPSAVVAMPGARAALDRLRAAGLRLGVVTNQSGIARGLLTPAQVDAVNRRVGELLGPFDTWQVCPHGETDGCGCRKPGPGLVYAAARALGTEAARCVVVGDIGRDMGAALAAGATGVLVPTPVTLPGEITAAPSVVADLPAAADAILARHAPPGPAGPDRPRPGTVLAVRADSAGDVLVTGPAIRAIAGRADRVVLLCGGRGRSAAGLLPGVDTLIEHTLPWIDPDPQPVDRAGVDDLVARIAAERIDEAVIFTSYHQSPLPLALLLRLAGIRRIAAISDDYPGSLLDVRHRVPDDLPEPERALSLAAAAGFPAPADCRLRIREPGPAPLAPGYVVVHPGASVPARACPPQASRRIVRALVAAGRRVVVTGSPDETALTAAVAGADAIDLGGRTDLAGLAAVIAGAACIVVGNTGPAHLAAAVGTPVVSLYAPTVPFVRWAPFRVPLVRIGAADAACRDTRASHCPVPGHPCLSQVEPSDVAAAVDLLTNRPAHIEVAA